MVGGFRAGNAETVTKGVPTSGRIANGAIIEREVNFTIGNLNNVKLTLRNPDFTTARRIAQAVNAFRHQRRTPQRSDDSPHSSAERL